MLPHQVSKSGVIIKGAIGIAYPELGLESVSAVPDVTFRPLHTRITDLAAQGQEAESPLDSHAVQITILDTFPMC